MALTIPDQGEGDHNQQSVCYQEDWDVLVAGLSGTDCVLFGCDVTGGTDMTPAVSKGAVLSNGVMFAVAAADVTIGTADATHPRFDLIVVNSSGALAVRAGTAAAAPKPPVRSTNDVVLRQVYVPANATQITQARCIDKRVIRSQGPIVIAKVTTPATFSNTTANETYFSASIPSGLFTTGRILRFRCGGILRNFTGSNRSTDLTIAYGGTSLFVDAYTPIASDTDYRAWSLDFTLSATSTTAQTMRGRFTVSNAAAATTGLPSLEDAAIFDTTIAGTSSVDSDAANRTLTVQMDMNAASADFETSMTSATLELL